MGMSCPVAIMKKLQKCIFVLFWSFFCLDLQLRGSICILPASVMPIFLT